MLQKKNYINKYVVLSLIRSRYNTVKRMKTELEVLGDKSTLSTIYSTIKKLDLCSHIEGVRTNGNYYYVVTPKGEKFYNQLYNGMVEMHQLLEQLHDLPIHIHN